ncbi:unnamed protein product [Rotaria sp. Silwood2]|nr:unnamed protein product [Rotaria sp. Silwood2]CAF2555897.1 unnamed protein product [Rotaria sp. Silwood2]CAF2818413.1 unnamed protein product [Rotaria sp. Silwood2]CAF2979501.1 unnamed protein product [Rotaria sp. Silwood2]CAF4186448.1 unnamed protein product [Rotaria sp. Silwood2]
MATPSKDYRYSVEFNIHAVDAPGTHLARKGDIYLNICVLGVHKRTRLMPPHLPMHIDQKLFFEKVFKFCYDVEEIIERLEREHILIELIQNDIPSPILLASYETRAKDFLYPYSSNRIEYTGLRRYVLLTRTIDFPGISPSFEFSTSPSVIDVTGLTLSTTKTHGEIKFPKRSASPTWKPPSAYPTRPRLNDSANVSRSITSHTISSALRHDYGQQETQEKLRELAVDRDINYVTPIDKTKGRPPFVVRHVTNDLIGRRPKSHTIFKDGVVVNNYTLARGETSASLNSFDGDFNRSRSLSPVLGRSISSFGGRARSPSPSRRSLKLSQSMNFDSRERSRSPSQYLYNDYTADNDIYSSSPPRHLMSPTLLRDSFRYRYRYSPAADLSDKVINTLRRNLTSYSSRPWHRYYSSYRYSDGHIDDDDDVLERSRRLTQD